MAVAKAAVDAQTQSVTMQLDQDKGSQTPTSTVQLISKIPKILPHERVFPIQIGSELFKLSGASLSSDGELVLPPSPLPRQCAAYWLTRPGFVAPSYFSQYFKCQIKTAEENGQDIASAIRTLYIDRDPGTFRYISLHLQGYHVQPRDGTHFVRLFADAQFYNRESSLSAPCCARAGSC